jgi:hypothetical protein
MRHGLPDDDADACGDAASSMVAGRSAREVAQGADDAARTLERKAAYARRRAANFRQGAAGEQSTADALAELSREGWVVLHDRLLPTGVNGQVAVPTGGKLKVPTLRSGFSWS